MARKSRLAFLEEAVGLLVDDFGVDRVRAAIAEVSSHASEQSARATQPQSAKRNDRAAQSVTSALENLRQTHEEKHDLLADFYTRLKEKVVLAESQDIRHFAQRIGLKEIAGKSRKDLIPKLMRFLVEQPLDRLQVDIKTAANISEQQRQQGFSVLTDKLLGEKERKKDTG